MQNLRQSQMKRLCAVAVFLIGIQFPFSFLTCLAAENGSETQSQPGGWTHGRIFDHFIVIVLENQDYEAAVKDPYLKDLSQQGALLTHFSAVTHPSYPNYLAMVSGSYFNVQDDTQITIDDRTVADLLETRKLTWKGYAQAYPENVTPSS